MRAACGTERGIDRRTVGDIGGNRKATDCVRHVGDGIGAPANQAHPVAVAGQHAGDRCANATAATGDDRMARAVSLVGR